MQLFPIGAAATNGSAAPCQNHTSRTQLAKHFAGATSAARAETSVTLASTTVLLQRKALNLHILLSHKAAGGKAQNSQRAGVTPVPASGKPLFPSPVKQFDSDFRNYIGQLDSTQQLEVIKEETEKMGLRGLIFIAQHAKWLKREAFEQFLTQIWKSPAASILVDRFPYLADSKQKLLVKKVIDTGHLYLIMRMIRAADARMGTQSLVINQLPKVKDVLSKKSLSCLIDSVQREIIVSNSHWKNMLLEVLDSQRHSDISNEAPIPLQMERVDPALRVCGFFLRLNSRQQKIAIEEKIKEMGNDKGLDFIASYGKCLTPQAFEYFLDRTSRTYDFTSQDHAKRVIETWRKDYNDNRPHGSFKKLILSKYASSQQFKLPEALLFRAPLITGDYRKA